MAQVRARWLTFYSEHVEPVSKEIFSHVEKMIAQDADRLGRRPCLEHGAVDRSVRLSPPWPDRPRRHAVRRHSPVAEFPRRPLQAREAELASLRSRS